MRASDQFPNKRFKKCYQVQLFVNLPISDVARPRQFYQSLGYSVYVKFSDASGARAGLKRVALKRV